MLDKLTFLKPEDMQTIAKMRDEANARDAQQAGTGRYYEIYEAFANLLVNKYNYETSDSTVLWLRGATEANAGRGVMSELIRVYSDMQAQLRYNEHVSIDLMQKASDAVTKKMLLNLFGEGDDPASYSEIPAIDKIGNTDATAVGEVLFNRDLKDSASRDGGNAAWSGTLLFTLLRNDQTWRLIGRGNSPLKIDSLNDWRDILYAYYSYKKGVMAAAKKGGATYLDTLILFNGSNVSKALSSVTELLSDTVTLGRTGYSYFNEQRGDVFDKGGTLFQTLWSGSKHFN
ncbi:hypothetical protein [Acinetobacter boissieri]|uniref:Uncharacterized protein n=1 Tax=Acinetobacter boissieri TaxID=1219383 RepID=A0A1G6IRL4_9GAMM|nr:hypothetical protein [Acinetobacter boissieri]SDC09137.1 hypothetical protein SAMN05421733_10915 [Acinetobacter boissieri]